MILLLLLAVSVVWAHSSVFDRCLQCLPNSTEPQSLWPDDRCPPGQSPLVGPHDSLPNGVQCCATRFGDKIAECETNSCAETFGGFDHLCFNYGADGKNEFCPYSVRDRAICDVSYYSVQNRGQSCRENSKGNCLGKVKCGTDGVVLVDGQPSNGTANGVGPCASSSLGFTDGEDCFYDGKTEQWKVCSHSTRSKRMLLATTRKPSTRKPTKSPSTRKPTKVPTVKPTRATKVPTTKKTHKPSNPKPTKKPSTLRPSKRPTVPFGAPDPEGEALFGWPWWWPLVFKRRKTKKPTTRKPSKAPTQAPGFSLSPSTLAPTRAPTASPVTLSPTKAPTANPTTTNPTKNPTTSPTTTNPTKNPTTSPTRSPTTASPTNNPTTTSPTKSPTKSPTASPTRSPTTEVVPA